jgi:hypothetical protein
VAIDVVLAALAEAERYEPDFRASDHWSTTWCGWPVTGSRG